MFYIIFADEDGEVVYDKCNTLPEATVRADQIILDESITDKSMLVVEGSELYEPKTSIFALKHIDGGEFIQQGKGTRRR